MLLLVSLISLRSYHSVTAIFRVTCSGFPVASTRPTSDAGWLHSGTASPATPRHATPRHEQNRTEQSDSNRAGTRCRHGIRANGWSRSKFVLIGTLTNSVPTIMVVTGTA
ncbi:hypothetical protein EHW66_13260 [Erwinia psidii]|uniref:hypothetical protein n=1 Tax=Erwinia psidii TaxID=69224 RepID=UPI00226B5182|nr:hypothetical protein [Erwinia psidii]MCX8965929.1 hypothetical protein [Erwinia psidii]